MAYDLYEDKIRKDKKENIKKENKYSPYCDFVYYDSTITPGLKLAMRVLKPKEPSYILAGTHGWHMSIYDFEEMDEPREDIKYLTLEIDMRGRAYSDGKADCNGYELYDVIDAVNFAKKHYTKYLIDDEVVYYESGSGGGGNGYAILGKFPDFFAASTVLCGISDYKMWYENDVVGEFRDEMDVWIGKSPKQDDMAYKSRSGLSTVDNLLTPLFIAHGNTDIRVPVEHAREYVKKCHEIGKDKLVSYFELDDVGDNRHWGKATDEQMEIIKQKSEQNRIHNKKPISIPNKGTMIVTGYLLTKKFSVFLDSIDKVAKLHYDLENDIFDLSCDVDFTYQLRKF